MVEVSRNFGQLTAMSRYCADSQHSNGRTNLAVVLTVFNIRPAQSARPRVVSAERMAEARSRLCTASPSIIQPTRKRKIFL